MKKLLFFFIWLLLVIPCQADIITVDDDGPADFDNIQAAIDDANDGDTIEVQLGTYTGDGNRNIGFLGKAITLRSIDPNDPNVVAATIIDCQGSNSNRHRAFSFVSGEGPDSVLHGFTITGSYAVGGAIYCKGSPTINHCVIEENYGVSWGGGVRIDGSSPRIIECVIRKNRVGATYAYGGAIYGNGNPIIRNCVIEDNTARSYGGGIMLIGGSARIQGCIIRGNSAHIGGGIYCKNSNPIIANCVIVSNSVNHNGGGLFLSCAATVEYCTITINSTAKYGAGIYCSSSCDLSHCIIWGNNGPEIKGSGFDINYSDVEGGYPGIGNIDVDPLFVDPGNDDYHLSANSFCINSGDPAYAPDPCKTDIDGEPRVINGRTDIGADEFNYEGLILASYPTEFSFSAYTLGPNPATQTLFIRNNGIGTLHWEIVEDCPWLEINPICGESMGETNEVVLSVETSGLTKGLYNCELTVNAGGVFNSPQTVLITLDLFEPVIEINPEQIEFSSTEGQRHPDDQLLNIFNSGTGTLGWWISSDCNWLEMNPSSGESTGEIDQITLAANISNLDPGIYSCTLTVDSNYASNTPKIVPVTLHVPDPYINYTPASFDLFMVKGEPPPANQVLAISNGGGSTLIWEIDANCSWVQATPVEGETTDETDEVVLILDADELGPGSYSCIITISATDATNDPQSVAVSLYVHSDGIETLYVPSQFSTIQAAIDVALDGDTVIVAEGTYTGIGNRDIDFKGKKITIRSTEPNCPIAVASTIIDCNGTEVDPHRAFYFHSGEDANSILNGLTIKNGYSNDGGGIYCNSSSPTITNCNFVDCSAEDCGGGIYCYKSSPLISNCTFTGNSAFEGGAITTYSYWNYLCSPRIENCHIFGNTASGSGGGINSDCLSTPIISNCLITGNFAGTYGGGGLSIFQSNPTITNCTIADNSTDSSGGGILQWYEFENGSTITNCIIANNNATHVGGGVYGSQNCDMTITNSVIFGNNGAFVGGVFCEWMQSLTMRNPHESLFAMGNIMVSYCDITGCGFSGPGWMPHCGIDGGGNIDMYPLFVNSATGNYHLLDGSICINAGDPDYIPAPDETDIDGQARMILGRVDIGADEFYPNVGPVACIIGIGCDRLIEAEALCEAKVTLDGSCSSDVDSSLGTNDDIEFFQWYRVDPYGSNDEEFLGSSEVIDCNLPLGEHTIILEVVDKTGAFDTSEVTIIVQDTTPPEVEVVVPQPDIALQDEVALIVEAFDICGTAEVYFYLREPNGDNGIQIGYEDLAAAWNTGTGQWEHVFDTTVLPDGYYVILAKAVDIHGNEGWSEVVPFNIRNWVVLELLPTSRHFRSGRTVPVKFALRIDEAVDPDMPFVYNEELEVRIFDAANPGNILQTSLYGDASKDYRIDSVGELYITNFKTAKTPAVYEVEIWRTSDDFQVGTFTFSTMILGNGDLTGDGKTDFDDLVIITENWLGNDTIADIAPYPDGDGIVDFRDFAVFAESWFNGTSQ